MDYASRLEKKNQEINALARSLKYDKLSAGQYDRMYSQLYMLILDYKNQAPIVLISDPNDNNKENAEPLFKRSFKDELIVESIGDSFLAAFADYCNIPAEKEEWPFIIMFNSYLKKNNLSFDDKLNRATQGSYGYNVAKRIAETVAKEIANELKIKDFSLPKNIMQSCKTQIIPLFQKHNATEDQINRLKNAVSAITMIGDTIPANDEDKEDSSIFDTIADNSQNQNTKTIENEYILQALQETMDTIPNEAGKKWATYFLTIQFIKNDTIITDSVKTFIDEEFIQKFRAAQEQQPDELDPIAFLCEYLGRKRPTVLRSISDACKAFAKNPTFAKMHLIKQEPKKAKAAAKTKTKASGKPKTTPRKETAETK